ncbi:MAG: nicotinate (nicotinamide) nucleotide adenylyltransferase [Cyanobacteria bacterium J069]|nr:MAG: nicotinate (nicotinamide) nucleotide adenylyltransferase [Cyanobacteria bacterium J069]
MKRLGIFGGTFNPPHWGHLHIAEAAVHQGHLDRVLWVPAVMPPHRVPQELVAIAHRVEMVKRAIAPYPAFELCLVEPEFPNAPSYAIDLFHQLQQSFISNCDETDPADPQWFWIIGQDAFSTLPRWYRRQELIPRCLWLVAPRPSAATSIAVAPPQTVAQLLQAEGIPIRWQMLDLLPMTLASSQIRQLRGDRRPIYSLVPAAVHHYIEEKGLY